MSDKSGPNTDALNQIKKLLGPSGWIDEPHRMQPYLTSWRNGSVGNSPLIALPSTTQEVASLVKICYQKQIPMTPQGGNTGLVGGSIPSQRGNELIVSLSRMNKICSFDAVGSSITVEAGVILESLQDVANDRGFLFPLSIASEGSAQIGGIISTNAGGTGVLRYGNMRELVLGLEVVLPDGGIIANLKGLRKDNTGYNLSQYFIGAEGTLGIVTTATLKLFPKPNQTLTAILAIPNAQCALDLLQVFRKECAEYLSAFEIMSAAALKLVIKNIPGARYPGKAETPYYLLVELAASSISAPLRAVFENMAAQALDNGKILDAVLAESFEHAKQFWALRESTSEALRKEGTGIHFDISLPLTQLADFLEDTGRKISAVAPEMTLMPFGHIGDGNIHYNMYMPAPPTAIFRKQIKEIVFTEVVRRHGSISAEHGIGIERKDELKKYKAPAEINLMHKIKRAIDPDNLMNPGKIFDALY